MKEKVLASVLFIVIIASVTINTIILQKKIDETIEKVENLYIEDNGTKSRAEDIFDEFQQCEKYISITVNHDDITEIENSFVEMLSFINVGNTDDAEVMKSRLIHSLEHLRRLCGFNIDAII